MGKPASERLAAMADLLSGKAMWKPVARAVVSLMCDREKRYGIAIHPGGGAPQWNRGALEVPFRGCLYYPIQYIFLY